MTLQVLVNGVVAAGPIVLVAMGLSLVFSVTKVFHLAHAFVITLAAYVAFGLVRGLGYSPIIGWGLSVLIAIVVGIGVETFIYRPLRRAGSSSLVQLVASLGVVIIGQNSISLAFGDQTLSIRSSGLSVGHRAFGVYVTDLQLLTVLVTGVACLGIIALMRWTLVGRLMRAVAGDIELAAMSGIYVGKIVLSAFAVASAGAAISGILVAYDTDLSPTMGFNIVLLGLIAAVVGGLGSVEGASLGGLFVGVSQHLAGGILSAQWQDAILFLILILFLLLRPEGFLGKTIRKTSA